MQSQKLTKFARVLWAEWKQLELPFSDAHMVVAVSGGADSTALLLACGELRRAKKFAVDFVVAHLNHGLRGGRAEEDARWVAELAKQFGFEAVIECADVNERARESRDNLEQAARRSRYEFLRRVAEEKDAHIILTAHTLDDQAETFLLRLLRGSGAEGLSGMKTISRVPSSKFQVPSGDFFKLELGTWNSELTLVRPFLSWARREMTESYCRERDIEFRSDEMNADVRFARARVRREILPLLEKLNPRAIEALARTAEILREDDEALNAEAEALLAKAQEVPSSKSQVPSKSNELRTWDLELGTLASLYVEVLRGALPAVRVRALRLWLARGRGDLRRIERVHIRAVEKLLDGERGGRVAELPGGCRIERKRQLLIFRANKS